MSNATVLFAFPYVDEAGKTHNPGATGSLPETEARRVIHKGLASAAKPKSSSSSRASTAKRPAAKKSAAKPAPASTENTGV